MLTKSHSDWPCWGKAESFRHLYTYLQNSIKLFTTYKKLQFCYQSINVIHSYGQKKKWSEHESNIELPDGLSLALHFVMWLPNFFFQLGCLPSDIHHCNNCLISSHQFAQYGGKQWVQWHRRVLSQRSKFKPQTWKGKRLGRVQRQRRVTTRQLPENSALAAVSR